MSGESTKPNFDVSTPDKQLWLLCSVLGNPKLPRQQLNRLLQCRMAWRADKGLPPTFRRALQSLSDYSVDLPSPAKPKKPRKVAALTKKRTPNA